MKIYADSSAGKAMAQREGVGNVRRLEARYLWLQQYVRKRIIEVPKIDGLESKADIGTKYLDGPRIKYLLSKTALRRSSGLQKSAGSHSATAMGLMLHFALVQESMAISPSLEVGEEILNLIMDPKGVITDMVVYSGGNRVTVRLISCLLAFLPGVIMLVTTLYEKYCLRAQRGQHPTPRLIETVDVEAAGVQINTTMDEMGGYLEQQQYGSLSVADLKDMCTARSLRSAARANKEGLVRLLVDQDYSTYVRIRRAAGTQTDVQEPTQPSQPVVRPAANMVGYIQDRNTDWMRPTDFEVEQGLFYAHQSGMPLPDAALQNKLECVRFVNWARSRFVRN